MIAPHTYDHTESRYIGTGLPKTMSFYTKGTFALAIAVARLPIHNIYILRAADLDWIIGPGYSLGGYILEKNHEKTTWNHEKP